jgi:hypothetical protein
VLDTSERLRTRTNDLTAELARFELDAGRESSPTATEAEPTAVRSDGGDL